jgi:hypothetical protein
VVDEHGLPVSGAAIRLIGDTTLEAGTDSTGTFLIPVHSPGRYSLWVRAFGYNLVRNAPLLVDSSAVEYRVVLPQRVYDGPCADIIIVR